MKIPTVLYEQIQHFDAYRLHVASPHTRSVLDLCLRLGNYILTELVKQLLYERKQITLEAKCFFKQITSEAKCSHNR